MSNIDSSGGVRGRVGRSMDYSQLLTIRKQDILTSAYRGAVEDSKPVVFNRDKKTSGFDNGVVQVYFQKGLFLSSSRGGNVGYGSRRSFTIPVTVLGGPDVSGLTAAEIAIYRNVISYASVLGGYIARPSTKTLSEVQTALALVTNLPITIEYIGAVGESITVTGNIDVDSITLNNVGMPAGFTKIVVYYT